MDRPRKALLAAAEKRGHSLTHLSAVIGRNSAYLQQYVMRRSPRRLPEDDRYRLAVYLNVDEVELGARQPYEARGVVLIPCFDLQQTGAWDAFAKSCQDV